MYVIKREDIAYARDIAMAQLQVSKDKGIEYFNDYRKTMFPWVEAAKARDEDQHKKLLEKLVKAGPLAIRPLNVKPATSRLVKRKEQRETKETEQQRRDRQNALYKKLGSIVPV